MKKSSGLKIGIIGVGMMGRHHARICSTLPGIDLVGIADLDEKRGQEIAQKHEAQFFNDYQALLPLIDAAIIVTPTATHFEIAQACLNSGKNILVEKPLAQNSADAQKLAELAKQKNLILAVGHIERFNPAFVELARMLRKEKLIGLHIKRLSPFPERITDANVIQDMMIHDLDMLRTLLPHDEIEEFKASGSKEKTEKLDRVSATFYFKSGLIAKVDADRVFGIKTRKIVATTERALLEADLLKKAILVRDLQHHIPSVHHVKQSDQLTDELQDFFKAIKAGSPPRVTGEDGYQAIKLAEEVENKCS